jgi:hypothetical protein
MIPRMLMGICLRVTRFRHLSRILAGFSWLVSAIVYGQDCSSSIVNHNCSITINREAASTPLPFRLYPNSTLTVIVNKRPLEKIQFDVSYADTAPQDPFQTIFSAFVPAIKQVTLGALVVAGGEDAILEELRKIQNQQLGTETEPGIQGQLAALKKLIDTAANELKSLQQIPAGTWNVAGFTDARNHVLCDIEASGTRKTTKDTLYGCTGSAVGAAVSPAPVGVTKAMDDLMTDAVKKFEALPTPSPVLVTLLNAVASNQAQLDDSLKAVQAAQASLLQTAAVLEGINVLTLQLSDSKSYTVNPRGLNRTATIKVSTQDLISNTSTAVVTITAIWGATHWETSTGALFSALKNRSFQNSPIIMNGKPNTDSSGKVNTQVTQSTTWPTVVPVAFAHYRLVEWARNEQRFAFLLTGGIGINPYSASADFATGLTFGYRSFMITPLLHFGRDLRLTNGLALGEQLGSGPPSLSTERYWVRKFGIAITYRLPIN